MKQSIFPSEISLLLTSQLKVLLGSMYPDGIACDYSGTSNSKISPLYQYIHGFSEVSAPSGAVEGIGGVLQNLFNDTSEEAKLLAHQLFLLNNPKSHTTFPNY